MSKKIYTVYDQKSDAYLLPFYMDTDGQATRAFSDLVNDSQHEFGKHPEDYTLFSLGDYNESNAKFSICETPISMGLAIEFKNNSLPKFKTQPKLPNLKQGK